MGELIDFAVLPKDDHVFYKITSSAFAFELKASEKAAVGLSSNPGDRCSVWVIIGEGSHSYIWEEDIKTTQAHTPQILSKEEFRKFWIVWNSRCIKFGRIEESEPILAQTLSNYWPLKYVTFNTVEGAQHPTFWRLKLPPVQEIPKYRKVSGQVEWVTSDEQLPDGAVIGGHEDEALYIIRASHRGSLTPGKFVPSRGAGFISWGGEEHEKNDFEVLCGYNCTWEWSCYHNIPSGAIVAGYSEQFKEQLFVGRAEHNGHLIPGKVQQSHRVCYIPYDGREIKKEYFQILVDKDKKVHASNDLTVGYMFLPSHRSREVDDSDEDEGPAVLLDPARLEIYAHPRPRVLQNMMYEENVVRNVRENVDRNIGENVERNVEDNVERNVEDNVERNADEIVEH